MPSYYVPIWKEAPFFRLVLPLIAGIALQYYADLPVAALWLVASACTGMLVSFKNLRSFFRFKNYWISGVIINLLLLTGGCLATYYRDIRHHPDFAGRFPGERFIITARLEEPLSEKQASFKALASIESICSNDTCKNATGNILVYFKKHPSVNSLWYGSRIVFAQPLRPIPNTGNPGAFDYKQYCALHNIYHQVFLNGGEYIILPSTRKAKETDWLFPTRENILNILRKHILGKKEAGLAEALLIGYKDDLDKNLVQAYSNIGVVHIIAISGLHLGLIYGLLILLCRPFQKLRYITWIKPVCIIAGLWLFSLLTGGSASVSRSAAMFSFIALGEGIGKRTFTFNSLSASAFLLLCYNPFWLWDAGFQLSYLAVLSITIFMRPIYNWFLIANKMLDYVWKLNAITLAAQVLTAPLSIYQFHQFPVYFPITNLLAVPLSGVIVLAEIWLCACSGISWLARITGSLIYHLIKAMNEFVSHMEKLPFSIWDGLQLSFIQLILLYTGVACFSVYVMFKNKRALIAALFSGLFFMSLRSWSFHEAGRQNKLIVYNIPQQQAIDVISGRHAWFIGSVILPENTLAYRFHLRPSRILHRIIHSDTHLMQAGAAYGISSKKSKIVILNKLPAKTMTRRRYVADIVIVSGTTTIAAVLKTVHCKLLVFDSSIPSRKINEWKAVCTKYGVPYFFVAEKGAFIVTLI